MANTLKLFALLAFFLLLLPVSTLLAQTGTGSIKGKVIDKKTGEGLPGATIQIVGTYTGTVTDMDGSFELLDIKKGDYTIQISYLGFNEQLINGVEVRPGKPVTLNPKMEEIGTSLETVTVVGERAVIDLQSGKSEVRVGAEEIQEMTVQNVQDIVAMQAGVTETPDGLQIRGGRVYETQYMVDGINAQDPLAGTGFGVQVSANAVQDVSLITGGGDAEYSDGTSGIVLTRIKEGGDKFRAAGSWQRDNLGFSKNSGASWNTDIASLSASGPIPFTSKKLTYFVGGDMQLTDTYFRVRADQLNSSYQANDEFWAPRQDNQWSSTVKLAYKVRPGTKVTLLNQNSLNINQNTRTLQIIGLDAIVQPGLQYPFILNPDAATTYTHQSNLTALGIRHFFHEQWNVEIDAGRLFTRLRADANGRPFRDDTPSRIYTPRSIVSDPISVFNPNDPTSIFVNAGPGLYNNGGISTVWHDHYVEEYTLKYKFNFVDKKQVHFLTMGHEHKEQSFQWVDVSSPWVGAPIQVNDSVTIPSTSIGISNDVWNVRPSTGGIFAQDEIKYKGIIANIGFNFKYWAPGEFVDKAVEDPNSPVLQATRDSYNDKTTELFGRKWKARILPKLRVSFPVSENNVLYLNYGHSLRLPHPRFIYAGLDPTYQDRSFLSNLGNPDLDPEVTVAYEVGLKSQVTKDLGITLTAFYNDKYDFIVTRTIQIRDQTGRFTDRTFYINQDYARIRGVELGLVQRIRKVFTLRFSGSYQVATGKSNSANESLLQIKQQGGVSLSKEQYLAWDRPFDLKLSVSYKPSEGTTLFGLPIENYRLFVSTTWKSGLRYTPVRQTGVADNGRPIYEANPDDRFSEIGANWYWTDLKLSRDFKFKEDGRLSVFVELRNIFDTKNSQIINPVTGEAYKDGDQLPFDDRDPSYQDPTNNGLPPGNPARYLTPRQLMFGISFAY